MPKKKIIAIQADQLNSINIKTDTTFLLALEAQKRFHKIYWYETKDLNLIKGKVYAKAKEVRGFVERLVTYAKKGDVHGRRLIMQKINGKK